MEGSGKKRKGAEMSTRCQCDVEGQIQLAFHWSHLSLEDYSSKKKQFREGAVSKVVDSSRSVISGAVTAPACGAASLELPGRGLKRKIGCIDTVTQLGRKKKIDQDYEMANTIGEGKFGSVVLCRNKVTGEESACKTLGKGEEIVHREVEIMQHLSGHRGVVTLKAVYEDTKSFYLVMELCSGGRLLDEMAREGQYSERKAANIIKELMLTVRYCHEMGVVHRDIKPENILLTSSGQMKLADFGLAVRILDGQRLTGIVGSRAYVAPEVLVGDYSEKVDIWSAGVLLHALLVGALPFKGDSLETMFEAIKKENLDFSGGVWESVSQLARNLLSRMLTRSTSSRFTANEVLKHPWISFYTEPSTNACAPGTRPTCAGAKESKRKRLISCSHLNDDSDSTSTSASECSNEAGGGGGSGESGGLVDAVAVAISHMQISEPKRSRICSPSREECSSNMTTTNLCAAF